MPPSPRSTVCLPHTLDARVQARVQAGTPFAVLIREALSAYLADTRRPRSAPSPAAPSGAPERPLRQRRIGTAHDLVAPPLREYSQRPTARRRAARIAGYIPGQGLFVLNLTDEHQHLLQLLGKRYEWFYR